MTKISNKIKYIEKSFEDKPSFLIKIEGVEYISNGCVFVENTAKNIELLYSQYDCKAYIQELLDVTWSDISNVTDTRYMFSGCTSLETFSSEIPNVTNAWGMFRGCTSLETFSSEIPNMTNARYMFSGCTSLETFSSEIPNMTNAWGMFRGCIKLNK